MIITPDRIPLGQAHNHLEFLSKKNSVHVSPLIMHFSCCISMFYSLKGITSSDHMILLLQPLRRETLWNKQQYSSLSLLDAETSQPWVTGLYILCDLYVHSGIDHSICNVSLYTKSKPMLSVRITFILDYMNKLTISKISMRQLCVWAWMSLFLPLSSGMLQWN